MFSPRMGGPGGASWAARGLDTMHPDRIHMECHHTAEKSEQRKSDAPVAKGCAHHPIISPSAPMADMAVLADLARQLLAPGRDRGPSPGRRTPI